MTKRELELAKRNLETLIDLRDRQWHLVTETSDESGLPPLLKHEALVYAVTLAEREIATAEALVNIDAAVAAA